MLLNYFIIYACIHTHTHPHPGMFTYTHPHIYIHHCHVYCNQSGITLVLKPNEPRKQFVAVHLHIPYSQNL